MTSNYGNPDLILELNSRMDNLIQEVHILDEAGTEYAMRDTEFRSILAQEILKLRANGTAANLCEKVAFADENVRNAKYNLNIAESDVLVAKEKINAEKLKIRLLESQINREWNLSGNN